MYLRTDKDNTILRQDDSADKIKQARVQTQEGENAICGI